MSAPHDFVNKALTVNLWGMDAALKPFTGSAQTRHIAERAVELEFKRPLSVGEIIGVGYQGKKSRFRVTQTFLLTADAYRITLEEITTTTTCMWREEMESPDVVLPRGERRKEPRLPVVGTAELINAAGASSTAKLVDVSQHGCYIEIYSPSPVGSEVRLLLSLEGMRPVDVNATVRTSHPSIGMGMEFTRFASADDSERLRNAVEALRSQFGE